MEKNSSKKDVNDINLDPISSAEDTIGSEIKNSKPVSTSKGEFTEPITENSTSSPQDKSNKSSISQSNTNSEESSNYETISNSNSSGNSNNHSLDIYVLNELSKTARMGMSTISFLASRISNKKMKKELVAIYSQYSNIMLQVNQHFEKYGEIPEDPPIVAKMMTRCGIRMSTMKDRSNSHIAEMMIQGTQMGIIECQKLLNENLDVEDSTIDMIKTLIAFQAQNVEKLNEYL